MLKDLSPEIVKLIANGSRMSDLHDDVKRVIVVDVQRKLAALKSKSYRSYYPEENSDLLVLNVWMVALDRMSVEYVYRILHAFMTGQIDHKGHLVGSAEFASIHTNIKNYHIPDFKKEALLLLENK